MKFTRKLLYFLFATITNLLAVTTASAIGPGIAQDVIGGALNPTTIPSTLVRGSMAALLCGYRLLLCGKVELVIVATATFVVGLMIMNRKMKWPYAVLLITLTVIFTNPEIIVKGISHLNIFGADLNLEVFANVCTCDRVDEFNEMIGQD